MTTLFDHTGLPLWVYIVLIVVGSILVLVTIAVALRCWVLRRNARPHEDSDGLTGGPMRRVTLRRGRMVPTSQHLSLTGSKFGMRQFGVLADNESTMTGRRSPFEWWNTIMDRSQSRQDQMSQIESGSIHTRPTSRAATTATRREILHDTPMQTPEKKESVTRTWELTLPSESPSPSPIDANGTPNFSRSFSNRAPSSPLTQRSQATLSRISERSPHQSMISTTTGPVVSTPTRTSYRSAINPQDNTPPAGQLPQLNPTMPRKSMLLAAPPPRSRPTTQSPSPSTDQSNPPYPKRSSSRRRSQREPVLDAAPRLSIPKPVALSVSTAAPRSTLPNFDAPMSTSNSFYRQPNQSRTELSHSRKNSNTKSPAASTHSPRRSSSSIGPSGVYYDSQVPRSHNTTDYWSSRTDLQEITTSAPRKSTSETPRSQHSRNPSVEQSQRTSFSPDEERGAVQENRFGNLTVPGKHNTRVLRKKSIKRMQVVSSL